jgi:hypothetical protein
LFGKKNAFPVNAQDTCETAAADERSQYEQGEA